MHLRRRILLPFLGLLAVAGGLLAPSAAQAAPAAPAYPGNGYHYYEAYGDVTSHNSTGFVQLHATNRESTFQVWINGTPSCPVYNGATRTWCGFSGNGNSTLTAGINYVVSGTSYWLRIDIRSGSAGTSCTVRGNANVQIATYC